MTAMSKMSRETEGYPQSEPVEDVFGDADSISSMSEPDECPEFHKLECGTSDEEQEAEVAAPKVGESLARDIEPLIHVRVFKHVISHQWMLPHSKRHGH